jgi:CelD/BcsL family acetyltransferase involved in cellulose biosynthesis
MTATMTAATVAHDAASPTLGWTVQPQRLRFSLGDLTLFTYRFQAYIPTAHFLQFPADPDELVLPDLKNGAAHGAVVRSQPCARALPKFSAHEGLLRYCSRQYKRHYIELNGTFAEYLAKFSSKSRSTLQRKVKKVAQASGGEVQWREYKRADEMDEFYAHAREISRKTYQEKLYDAGVPETAEYRNELIAMASRDAVRGFVLFFNGAPAAYLLFPAVGRVLIYSFLGYDPQYRDLSLGAVLHYFAIERLFDEQQFTMLDFTEGQGPTKQLFSNGSAAVADLFLLPDTFKNRLLLKGHDSVNRFGEAAGRLLERLGAKQQIKRWLRRT